MKNSHFVSQGGRAYMKFCREPCLTNPEILVYHRYIFIQGHPIEDILKSRSPPPSVYYWPIYLEIQLTRRLAWVTYPLSFPLRVRPRKKYKWITVGCCNSLLPMPQSVFVGTSSPCVNLYTPSKHTASLITDPVSSSCRLRNPEHFWFLCGAYIFASLLLWLLSVKSAAGPSQGQGAGIYNYTRDFAMSGAWCSRYWCPVKAPLPLSLQGSTAQLPPYCLSRPVSLLTGLPPSSSPWVYPTAAICLPHCIQMLFIKCKCACTLPMIRNFQWLPRITSIKT